ncbi:MAG: hypothetical protein P8J86_11475 [Phycisphaerales bacterium]|nr:hypothetical protein [Phycisphaerales bacterium]
MSYNQKQKYFVLLASLITFIGLCSCQQKPANLALLNASPVTPATRPLLAPAYGLLQPGTTRYVNLEKPQAEPLTITIAPDDRFGGSVSRTLNDQRIEYLGISKRGNTVMHASTDIKRGTTTIFPTPLILASASQPPLQPAHQEVPAQLVDSESIKKVEAHGIGRRTAVYEGSCVIETNQGPITTQQIRTMFRADLSIAQARYTGLIFVANQPQPGIVAMVLTEELRVFGIPMRSESGTYLREDLVVRPTTAPSSPNADSTRATNESNASSG